MADLIQEFKPYIDAIRVSPISHSTMSLASVDIDFSLKMRIPNDKDYTTGWALKPNLANKLNTLILQVTDPGTHNFMLDMSTRDPEGFQNLLWSFYK